MRKTPVEDAAEEHWSRKFGALEKPEALVPAVTAAIEAVAAVRDYNMVDGRLLQAGEREPYLAVFKARFLALVERAAAAAPTLTLRRLARSPDAHAAWKDRLEAMARGLLPDTVNAAPDLVQTVNRLRLAVARGARGEASIAPPASPCERALHHARSAPSAPIRELLGLLNGFTLFGGRVRMPGIFDGGRDMNGTDGGKDAGVIYVRYRTEYRVTCAADGRLVASSLVETPTGLTEWREAPPHASRGDLAAFLNALATLNLGALRRLFPDDPPLDELCSQDDPDADPNPPTFEEEEDLAAIKDLHGPEAQVRALGEACVAAGDPWGEWILAQLAGKVAPSDDELCAFAGDLEPAFRPGPLDKRPALAVEFRRGFAWRVRARSTFDLRLPHLLRALHRRAWGRRFEHLVVEEIDVSHAHRFEELWGIFDEVGLPRTLQTLVAGNAVAEHRLPATPPRMEALTLRGRRLELDKDGVDLGPLKRLTLDGAVRFGDLAAASWPAPELMTLRAPRYLDAGDTESFVASTRALLGAALLSMLPRLRLEGWTNVGEQPLSGDFARSALTTIELSRCDPSFVSEMQRDLGARVTLMNEGDEG